MDTNVDSHIASAEAAVAAVQEVVLAMKVDLAVKEAFISSVQSAIVAATLPNTPVQPAGIGAPVAAPVEGVKVNPAA